MVSWSGGKDSTMALYHLRETREYEIHALLTTLSEDYDRVSMHGVRRTLLEEQAKSLGYPLRKVFLAKDISNEEYVSKMREALMRGKAEGVVAVAFGDIFLEDLRKFREENLDNVGMRGVFPLWKRDTLELASSFIDLGFKAITTCVDSSALGKEFVGRDFDEEFLSQLPSSVDPCGENGEFHTLVYDGPLFNKRVSHSIGEVTFRDNRFYYCDLLPQE